MASSQPSNVMYGASMIVAAMSLIGLIDNFVRMVAEEAGIWQFHLVRSLIAIPIVVCFCVWKTQRLRPKRLWAVVLRSFLMASALIIYFSSITLMPIAEAGATLFSAPIFLLIFSVLIFRTRIDMWRIMAVIVGFAGMALVLKPDVQNLDFAALVPLLAGMLYALGQLTTRHLCGNESTAVVLIGFFVALGLFGCVGALLMNVLPVPEAWQLAAPFFFTGWVPPTGRFFFWTAIQAVGSIVAVTGLIRGYQVAEPTYIAVFEYSFLIFAGFWGWVLWQEIPDALGFAGIFAIVCAGVIITIRAPKSTAAAKT